MAKLAVVYWSGTGNTEAMARMIEEQYQGEVVVTECTDFTEKNVSEYDVYAFGSPSMGAEVLEESDFQPMWDDVKASLKDKKVMLFGSYGWGDGEWIRNWEEECAELGINVVGTWMCNEAPSDENKAECSEVVALL